MRFKFCVLMVLLVPSAAYAGTAEIAGRATVVDGDTLTVNGRKIRLWGIDAPESTQQCQTNVGKPWPCGRRAANSLDQLLEGKSVRCRQRDVDRYGRTVGECFVQGQSVNAWMVQSGWAVAYREYSTAYVSQEASAKRGKVNLWQGAFQQPAEYRRAKRAASEDKLAKVAPPASGCAIKGNISSGGRKIYHSPGQRDYTRTSIDPKRGERYFCTPEEARRAGWRAAQR